MDKKTFAISVLTVLVQYYDYHLFGFIAANVASYFFPKEQAIVALLNTYLLMSVAMIAKPLGAIIFGKMGDVVGRANSFKKSLVGTSIASLILFLTPPNEVIGFWAVVIVFLCRLVVCAFVSSGSDGVRIYVYEHVSPKRQALVMSITIVFTLVGSLLASLATGLFNRFSVEANSWKYTLLVGSVLGVIVLLIMKITNFRDQIDVKKSAEFDLYKNLSLLEIIKNNKILFTLCLLLAGAIGSTNQFIVVFIGTYYFQTLGLVAKTTMQNYISISIAIYMIFSLFAGLIADIFGKYRVSLFATISLIIVTIIHSLFLSRGEFSAIFIFLTTAILPFIVIPSATILTSAIPKVIRYRMFSLSHAVGSIIISSPTAFIATYLYHKTNINWLPLCYFIVIISVISFTLYKLNGRVIIDDDAERKP